MAINLNLDKYGAQFNAFVDFANANSNDEDTFACIGGGALLDHDGKPRTIVAKNDGDKIKSMWKNQFFGRTGDQARLNDSTRAIFLNAVTEMFGGEANIPKSVKKAMLLGDYGDGKPLTARRIMAVKDAIDAEDSMREKEVSPHDFRRDVRRGGSCHRLRQGHRRQGHGSAATSIQSSSRAFTTRFRRAASAATSTAASSHTASRPTSTWPSRSPSSSLTAIDGAGQDCLGRDCPNMV